MKIAVDLDHTLCIPNDQSTDSEEKYGQAEPILEMIERVNAFYEEGSHITIYTARRMLTHNGNIQKVINDVGKITEDWLQRYGVKYHELVFGKIYYDLLIDDKSMRPGEFV